MMMSRYYNLPDFGFNSFLNDFDRLSKKLDLLGNNWFGETRTHRAGIFPAVNVTEDEENYYIRAEMPEVKAEDLNIDLKDNTLTIMGAVIGSEASTEKPIITEYNTGRFARQFSLTEKIDQDRIEAILDAGVLRLVMPKAEKALPRKIEVKAA